jgi:hypothetical protein
MPEFIRVAESCLLLANGPSGTNSDSTAGFFSFDATVPAALSLSDALGAPGCFVFFPTIDSALADFTTALQGYFQDPTSRTTKLAFFSKVAISSSAATQIYLQTDGSTKGLTSFTIGNLTLNVTGAAKVTVSTDGTDLILAPLSTAPHFLTVTTPDGQKTTVNYDGTLTLTMFGDISRSGSFEGAIRMDAPGQDTFDAGVRYFAPSMSLHAHIDSAGYRLFDLDAAGTTLEFDLVWDPLQPLNAARSYWSFKPQPALNSHFVNTVGLPLTLQPVTDGEAPARLHFAVRMLLQPGVSPGSQSTYYYLTPAGDFLLSATGSAASGAFGATLMPGLSAYEYFSLEPASTLRFHPGQCAYLPITSPPGADKITVGAPTADATTSWATIYAQGQTGYFAQPTGAAQHSLAKTDTTGAAAYLNFLPLQAGSMPPLSTAAEPVIFPITSYRGFRPSPRMTADLAQVMESQQLAPIRRRAIPPNAASANLMAAPAAPRSATPQGFLVEGAGEVPWLSLTLAQTPDTTYPTLAINKISGRLEQAFLTDPLFLVVSDTDAFQSCSTTNYSLTDMALTDLVLQTAVLPKISDAIRAANPPIVGGIYPSKDAFVGALNAAVGADAVQQYLPVLCDTAARFVLSIAGWHFDLSPETWSRFGTILLFKYVRQPLRSLVSSCSSWFDQGTSFNKDPLSTQQALRDFIQNADTAAGAGDADMADFLATVVDDPNWLGMLAINVYVPLTGLPEELAGLSAGIDTSEFYAHHVGVRLTPTQPVNGQITQSRSNTFGLIKYESPSYLSQGTPYDFKVLSLKVAFENAAITAFSSRIDLYVGELFGDVVNLAAGNMLAGNNLIFNGTYQSVGGIGHYAFVSAQPTVFRGTGAVLDRVEIAEAHLVTRTTADNGGEVTARFICTGTLSLKPLPVDLFSYGSDSPDPSSVAGLAFTGLFIEMDFDEATPSYKNFRFDISGLAFSNPATKTRSASLIGHFPIKLRELLAGAAGATPASMGYMSVGTPISTGALTSEWYGLRFDLDMGSLGALSSAAGFVASFMIAWSPGLAGNDGPPAFIGLKLPGVKNGDRAISLQGIIKLTFGDVELLAQGPSYVLAIRQIALSILSLSFPRAGQTSLYVFGDPANNGGNGVGWYGGYASPDIHVEAGSGSSGAPQ